MLSLSRTVFRGLSRVSVVSASNTRHISSESAETNSSSNLTSLLLSDSAVQRLKSITGDQVSHISYNKQKTLHYVPKIIISMQGNFYPTLDYLPDFSGFLVNLTFTSKTMQWRRLIIPIWDSHAFEMAYLPKTACVIQIYRFYAT